VVSGIAFCASRDLTVTGFGIYLPISDKKVEGKAIFFEGDNENNKVIFSKSISLKKDDGNGRIIYPFMFDKPVRVKASNKYSCCLQLSGGLVFYGVNGMTTVTDENKVVFTFSNFQGQGGTNTSQGQTPELYYYL